MNRNNYRSSQLEKKLKIRRRIKMVAWIILFGALFAGFVFLFNHRWFTISDFSISETEFVDEEKVTAEISALLDKKIIGLFSRRNILIIPREDIREVLLGESHAIEKVKIDLERFDHLNIEVVEYEPRAKWCGESYATSAGNCYFINAEGIIFASESMFDVQNLMKIYAPLPEDPEMTSDEIIGHKILTDDDFKNLELFFEKLPELNINPLYVDSEDLETFVIKTEQGPYLLIERIDDARDVLNNLKIVIDTEEINAAQFKNLEYIDLRFGNKVFYKIK